MSLTGCIYWLRAYEVYSQLEEFDHYFSTTVDDGFKLGFNEPVLYDEDFISLAKLQPSTVLADGVDKKWLYLFQKVDAEGNVMQPEVSFYFELFFNEEQRLTQWVFSPLFLQIAPAEFLEASIRSIGEGRIDRSSNQLKVDLDSIEKISAELPGKAQIVAQLGEPLKVKVKKAKEVYYYHFKLQTEAIEEGFDDRALTVVKLSFDKKNNELIKMSGRFIGLKLSINYRNYLEEEAKPPLQLVEKAIE